MRDLLLPIFLLAASSGLAQKEAADLFGTWDCTTYKDSSGVMGITAGRYILDSDGTGLVQFFDPLGGPMSEFTLMIEYEVDWKFDAKSRMLQLLPVNDELIIPLAFRIDKWKRAKQINLYEESSNSTEFCLGDKKRKK